MKRLNLKSLLDTREVHHLYVTKKELLVNFSSHTLLSTNIKVKGKNAFEPSWGSKKAKTNPIYSNKNQALPKEIRYII